jgi:hypothetical protein
MPKEFYKSHQNLIKYLIIGKQAKNFHTNSSYLFDSSSTVLYSITFNSLLLYNISKNLSIITETAFFAENEYKFRFVGPPPLPSFSHDGKLSVEPDLQFELHRDLGDELDSLNYIISEIQTLFCNK